MFLISQRRVASVCSRISTFRDVVVLSRLFLYRNGFKVRITLTCRVCDFTKYLNSLDALTGCAKLQVQYFLHRIEKKTIKLFKKKNKLSLSLARLGEAVRDVQEEGDTSDDQVFVSRFPVILITSKVHI